MGNYPTSPHLNYIIYAGGSDCKNILSFFEIFLNKSLGFSVDFTRFFAQEAKNCKLGQKRSDTAKCGVCNRFVIQKCSEFLKLGGP